jgi:hypothetical protein
MVEQDAALAGRRHTQSLAPERGRTPPGHTRVPCEELADGKAPGPVGRQCPARHERAAESADRTLDNAVMERREAPHLPV